MSPGDAPTLATEPAPSTRPVRAGVFRQLSRADQAVAALVAAGFTKEHITVICPERHLPHEEGVEVKEPAGNRVGKSALGGGAIGAALGGLAVFAGAGLLVVGPLVAAMAVAGSFVGAMMTRGVERETTNFYDQALRRGDILVAAEVDPGPDQPTRLADAARILAEAGAEPMAMRVG